MNNEEKQRVNSGVVALYISRISDMGRTEGLLNLFDFLKILEAYSMCHPAKETIEEALKGHYHCTGSVDKARETIFAFLSVVLDIPASNGNCVQRFLINHCNYSSGTIEAVESAETHEIAYWCDLTWRFFDKSKIEFILGLEAYPTSFVVDDNTPRKDSEVANLFLQYLVDSVIDDCAKSVAARESDSSNSELWGSW